MLALLGGSFLEPNPLDYFFGSGIGVNIGASVIWGFLAGFVGYLVARRVKRAWAHLHARLDRHEQMHRAVLARVEELHHLAYRGEPHPRVADRPSGD